jgi:hypothetical protein
MFFAFVTNAHFSVLAVRICPVNILFPAAPPPGIAALTSSSVLPRRYAPEQAT